MKYKIGSGGDCKDNNKILEQSNGHINDEVHIGDFIVLERNIVINIGTLTYEKVEEVFQNEDFDN